jgi:hypothetical protein
MIVAIVALSLTLGGSAVAATLISGSRLKNRSVSGAKIKRNGLGGNEIKESRLGKVPRATRADSSKSADSAKALVGRTKISYRAPVNTPARKIYDSGKLRLTAACDAAGKLTLTANTSSDHAIIESYGYGSDDLRDSDFLTTETVNAFSVSGAGPRSEERDVSYTEPGGQAVNLQYVAAHQLTAFGSFACVISGFAEKG